MFEDRAENAAASALDRAALIRALPITRGLAAFTPLLNRLAEVPGTFAPSNSGPEAFAPAPAIDPDQVAAAAYARGFADGRQLGQDELERERTALASLAAGLETLRPEPPQSLALLLAATVDRLVRQVIGAVEIDAALLRARAEAAAALIAEEAEPGRMRLHPEDAARLAGAGLPCALVPDPALAPGTVLLETRDGWIEHGPEVALNRLQAALDTLGAPR